jgi:hypothetical protein
MILMAMTLAAAWPSHAQQGSGRRADRGESARPPQQPPGQGRDTRQRDDRSGRQSQMSPEEREQLRRDIGNYGRDVYRDRGNKR